VDLAKATDMLERVDADHHGGPCCFYCAFKLRGVWVFCGFLRSL